MELGTIESTRHLCWLPYLALLKTILGWPTKESRSKNQISLCNEHCEAGGQHAKPMMN
jgi:hypothetical protein